MARDRSRERYYDDGYNNNGRRDGFRGGYNGGYNRQNSNGYSKGGYDGRRAYDRDGYNGRADRGDRGDRGYGGREEPACSHILIRDCPNDITEREIERICSKHGAVQNIAIDAGKADVCVYVRFGNSRQASAAIRALDDTDPFGAGRIQVTAFEGRPNGNSVDNNSPSPPRQSTRPVRVYLSQLPRDMEEDELKELATDYGVLLSHELHREGAYKCGWIEFGSKKEAEAAVKELDERQMDEWTMRIQAYMYPGGGSA